MKNNSRGGIRRQSGQIALCGVLAALSAAILSLGGLIPLATYACPLLAMTCLLPVLDRYGPRSALLLYAAAACLGLMLCADREIALLYLFLGWYPALRPRLERLRPPLRAAVKCAVFSLAVTAMYLLALYLFRLAAVAEEFAGYSAAMTAALLAMGNAVFLLFDRALGVLAQLYGRKRRRR